MKTRKQTAEADLSDFIEKTVARVCQPPNVVSDTALAQLRPIFRELMHATEAVKAIRIWHWSEAPEGLKACYSQGGDEDWIAAVPKALDETGFVEFAFTQNVYLRNPFGISSTERFETDDFVIYVGTHS